MARKLMDRAVLITGGSSGIGRAAAKFCGRAGAKVAISDIDSETVRVNAVCPGVLETPMLERMLKESGLDRSAMISREPIGRLGEPRETGDAVAWLLSCESSFVTGIALPVDGGHTAV